MTRLGYLIQCAAFGLSAALLGCGSNTPSGGGGATSALQLVPASNAVAGWKLNASNSKTANGAATATTEREADAAAASGLQQDDQHQEDADDNVNDG